MIPKPELREFGGDSLSKPTFGVTSAEVTINCPDTEAQAFFSPRFSAFQVLEKRFKIAIHLFLTLPQSVSKGLRKRHNFFQRGKDKKGGKTTSRPHFPWQLAEIVGYPPWK